MSINYFCFRKALNMPNKKKGHEDFRRAICGICWRKPKDLQSISPAVLSLIKTHCYPEYDLANKALPLSACKSFVRTVKIVDKVKVN